MSAAGRDLLRRIDETLESVDDDREITPEQHAATTTAEHSCSTAQSSPSAFASVGH